MLAALANALIAFSSGITVVPPRVAVRVPDAGLLGSMPGYIPGVALEVKLVSVFPGNHHRSLPSHHGVIALFDESDGAPLAIMDGTHITAIRTGGTAAAAAPAPGRHHPRVPANIWARVQSASHLETFSPVPDFSEIRPPSSS